MNNHSLDDLSPLSPEFCFAFEVNTYSFEKRELKKKHRLPDLSELLYEEPFVQVSLGWSMQGIRVDVDVKEPFVDVFFPNFRKGDSVELFIDTRNLKTAGSPTRFCHHFVFLPKSVDEIQAVEKTRLRAEETRELCDSKLLGVDVDFNRRGYLMKILLPSEALHGYDPEAFDKLGFACRVNRCKEDPMHFPFSSDQFEMERHPNLWAILKLIGNLEF